MLWLARLSSLFSASLVLLVLLSPSLPSFPPAEAIRSAPSLSPFPFRSAPQFHNSPSCPLQTLTSPCDPSLVHVALTLDLDYLRGSIAALHSILRHASCPDNVFFHLVAMSSSSSNFHLESVVRAAFPRLRFRLYRFDPTRVRRLISSSVRAALEQPLNYARNYLPDLLDPCVRRVIYLDSDLVVVDDISKLWSTDLLDRPLGAPEYCHANFTKYFTSTFWSDPGLSRTFRSRSPCYFNTGVMVMDLDAWRRKGYTSEIERWMEIQKGGGEDGRIYELGSLPPFLLVFAGGIAPIEHRWNQHGLGGDNVRGSCRDLHPGPVSLLHWSGSGKPWARLDARRPCPLDALWAPYDLYGPSK